MTGTPEGSTESGFMEKPGTEPETPDLQGIALIHYTTGASFPKPLKQKYDTGPCGGQCCIHPTYKCLISNNYGELLCNYVSPFRVGRHIVFPGRLSVRLSVYLSQFVSALELENRLSSIHETLYKYQSA